MKTITLHSISDECGDISVSVNQQDELFHTLPSFELYLKHFNKAKLKVTAFKTLPKEWDVQYVQTQYIGPVNIETITYMYFISSEIRTFNICAAGLMNTLSFIPKAFRVSKILPYYAK